MSQYRKKSKVTVSVRDELIEQNMGLVHSIASQLCPSMRRCGITYDDLVSEGQMVLMRCAELFDSSKGYQFSTYAFRSIQRRMLDLRGRTVFRRMVSLDDLASEEDVSDELRYSTVDPKSEREPRYSESEHQALSVAMKRIPAIDNILLCYRFGLYGVPVRTAAEIAKQLRWDKSHVYRHLDVAMYNVRLLMRGGSEDELIVSSRVPAEQRKAS